MAVNICIKKTDRLHLVLCFLLSENEEVKLRVRSPCPQSSGAELGALDSRPECPTLDADRHMFPSSLSSQGKAWTLAPWSCFKLCHGLLVLKPPGLSGVGGCQVTGCWSLLSAQPEAAESRLPLGGRALGGWSVGAHDPLLTPSKGKQQVGLSPWSLGSVPSHAEVKPLPPHLRGTAARVSHSPCAASTLCLFLM